MTVDALVAWLAQEPARTGLCLDFDGTLTPIVDDPASVRLPRASRATLEGLAARLGALALVSGRPARFLGERAAVRGARLLGLYGLEEWRDGASHARGEAARWQPAVEAARGRLVAALGDTDGLLVEDKGLSVAVHWRAAADRDRAGRRAAALVAELARETGLARAPGKLVEELRPPVDWDKGAAVRALAGDAGLRRLAYVGDDLGDLPAFAAVRALGGRAVAVTHGGETPQALLDAADLAVPGHAAVAGMLDRLLRALGG